MQSSASLTKMQAKNPLELQGKHPQTPWTRPHRSPPSIPEFAKVVGLLLLLRYDVSRAMLVSVRLPGNPRNEWAGNNSRSFVGVSIGAEQLIVL